MYLHVCILGSPQTCAHRLSSTCCIQLDYPKGMPSDAKNFLGKLLVVPPSVSDDHVLWLRPCEAT